MTRRAPLTHIVAAGVCALMFLVPPFEGAPASKVIKKKRKPAVAVIGAAARTAALRKVDHDLEATANAVIRQPGALAPVFEQLYRLDSQQTKDPVHIIHFGDSHTAADEWTGGLRDLFQQRFGDGGSGFSVAGHPFAGYRRFDARGGASTGWHSDGMRSGTGDGYFGLGGIGVSTDRAGQLVYLDTACDRIEIEYLQQPGGGRLALADNDRQIQDFSTDGELGAGYLSIETDGGPHRFVLTTLESKPVRLFGWVVDKDAGVTYEALGINGAEAGLIMKWNQDMLATYLQRRNPGLIVLAYGTNEASDHAWDQASYRSMFSSLLERLRASAPASSILVIGPGDRWIRTRAGWKLVDGIDDIIAAQRAACKANRAGFWDTRERMGGKGAMRDWVTAGLGQADRVHFTGTGYRKLASALFDDLMSQYAAYRKTRIEAERENGPAK